MGSILSFKENKFHFLSMASTFLAAIFIQIGTNFANDYFDYKNGADTPHRLGPTRLTASGLITPKKMKYIMVLTFLFSILCSSYIIWRCGTPIIIIGIISIFMGILYTGGPYPLGYYGLGDILVLLFFGPIALAGTYYVQVLEWSLPVILLGISSGLFSVAILAVNNLRDIIEDSQTGKGTLAVRLGKRFVQIEFAICIILGSTLPFIIDIYFNNTPNHWPLLTIIPGLKLIQLIMIKDGKELNNILGYTAKLYLLFMVLWCIGALF
tara:strand:- start:61 stop:861 length:801 start_codon:yes stop_codon:yes gene_type:complete